MALAINNMSKIVSKIYLVSKYKIANILIINVYRIKHCTIRAFITGQITLFNYWKQYTTERRVAYR